MNATHVYVAEQLAREYTRDRIREAEARQAVRVARAAGKAAREERYVDRAAAVVARVRRRWSVTPRATTA